MNRLHFLWVIFWLGVFMAGCAPEILKPFSPADEVRLQARVMAENICGNGSHMTECYKRALRWYYRLNGFDVNQDGRVTATRYCKPRNKKSRPDANVKPAQSMME